MGGKTKLAHTSQFVPAKKTEERAGGLDAYIGKFIVPGRVKNRDKSLTFSPGSSHDPGLKTAYDPGLMGNQPRAAPEPYEPGLMPPLVPVGKAIGTNASFLAGEKTCFLLVYADTAQSHDSRASSKSEICVAGAWICRDEEMKCNAIV